MEKNKTILYVDDDEDDRQLLFDAIKKADPQLNLILKEDGLKAINYLDKVLHPPDTLPCLIILDLNMPYLDGRSTFQKIRTNPLFQKIPVVIFTSSQNPNDKNFFQNAGIELISKPHDFSCMHGIARRMLQYCE